MEKVIYVFNQIIVTIIIPIFGEKIGDYLLSSVGFPKVIIEDPYIDSKPIIPDWNKSKEDTTSINLSDPGTVSINYLSESQDGEGLKKGDYSLAYFIHIPVKNVQKRRLEISTARNVYAKISFYDMKSQNLCNNRKIDIRWEKSDQPKRIAQNVENLRFKPRLFENYIVKWNW